MLTVVIGGVFFRISEEVSAVFKTNCYLFLELSLLVFISFIIATKTVKQQSPTWFNEFNVSKSDELSLVPSTSSNIYKCNTTCTIAATKTPTSAASLNVKCH